MLVIFKKAWTYYYKIKLCVSLEDRQLVNLFGTYLCALLLLKYNDQFDSFSLSINSCKGLFYINLFWMSSAILLIQILNHFPSAWAVFPDHWALKVWMSLNSSWFPVENEQYPFIWESSESGESGDMYLWRNKS